MLRGCLNNMSKNEKIFSVIITIIGIIVLLISYYCLEGLNGIDFLFWS